MCTTARRAAGEGGVVPSCHDVLPESGGLSATAEELVDSHEEADQEPQDENRLTQNPFAPQNGAEENDEECSSQGGLRLGFGEVVAP
jgi:hypothetical protein